MNNQNLTAETLYIAIAGVIQQARHQLRQVVNQQMVQAYWHIGRLIVEEEQRGQERAEYGKQQLKRLSERLQRILAKALMSATYAICDSFTSRSQNTTH